MPVTYQPAGPDVEKRGKMLMRKYHPHLVDYKVKVDYLFAFASVNDDGEKIGNALSFNGYPCLGIARILNLKSRVKGMGDCEICLDGDFWPELNSQQQNALIDHELTHFLIAEGEDGPKYDDLGRIMLKMRLHDWDVGFFHSIASRYGADSFEVIAMKGLLASQDGAIYRTHVKELN